MALVTVRRDSVSGSSSSTTSNSTGEDEEKVVANPEEIESFLSVTSSWKSNKRSHRQGSVSENFFAMQGAALILPKQSCLSTKNFQMVKQFGGELQTHLHAIFHHLRTQDNIKLAVRLESWQEEHRRYLVIISTTGRQDTEESIIVGCDFETKKSTTCTIGLVLPLWCDTNIRLDGDGGFHIESRDRIHTFKPVSVQAMWSALQSLHRCVDVSRRNNYYEGSLYLTWTGYYTSKISSDRIHINEWHYREDLYARKEYFEKTDPQRLPVEDLIRSKLKKVMMDMDLDNCTSRDIRNALENEIDMDLREYKEFIDTEMLTVLGQMDCSSKILDYLYLGSEWNASNLEELEALGITHILNMTIEIDNFFPDHFRYKAVRLYDLEESNLLPHWNHTWKFIADAKKSGGKCLVHCKMGISRSAATVCAYLMKEKLWDKPKALDHVKSCRSIVCPNTGFQTQLDEYEGIIFASAQRHNKLFRSRSESSLSEPSVTEDPYVVSPRMYPSHFHHLDDPCNDVVTASVDFDLNRRLLDITSLGVPKISRAKSWSPDEGRTPYHPNSFHTDPVHHRHFTMNENTNRNSRGSKFSEPNSLPMSSSGEKERKTKEFWRGYFSKRAHLRRHTTTTAPYGGGISDEIPQSEDSVFVHDGCGPLRFQRRGKTKKCAPHSSTPVSPPRHATHRPNILPVQSTPVAPSASALKSPSYINAQSVDVDRLKLQFVSKPAPVLEDVTNDVTRGASSPTTVKIAPSVPVRDIVAVIESPQDDGSKLLKLSSGTNLMNMGSKPGNFVRGHHKTASLPPRSTVESSDCLVKVSAGTSVIQEAEDSQSRNRSFSETQATSFSVKKIVTAIESGNLQDGSGDDDNCEVFHRSKSVPDGSRKKMTSSSSFVAGFPPVGESALEGASHPTAISSFYIGDTEMPPPSKIMTWCGSANSNNNNNSSTNVLRFKPVVNKATFSHRKSQVFLPIDKTLMTGERRPPPYSPDFLQVIEKVGLQLLGSADGSIMSSRSSEDAASNHSELAPGKKRGVRQMVREIEKTMRRLRGKALKSSKKSDKSTEPVKPVASPNRNYSKYVALTPSASPSLDDDLPAENSTLPDVHVRELVCRFDSPVCQSPLLEQKLPVEPSTPCTSLPLRLPPKDITDLVTPQPYRTPSNRLKSTVRRTQSEKFGLRSSIAKRPGYFRSFRMTCNNSSPFTRSFNSQTQLNANNSPLFPLPQSLVILEKDSSKHQLPKDSDRLSSSPVREIITNIENKNVKPFLSSSSVHRSSSMPRSSRNAPSVASPTSRKVLRKTKSSPFLDVFCDNSPSPIARTSVSKRRGQS